MHAHEWYWIFLCPDLLLKKQKDRSTDPPDFQAKRASKPFIYFRPNHLALPCFKENFFFHPTIRAENIGHYICILHWFSQLIKVDLHHTDTSATNHHLWSTGVHDWGRYQTWNFQFAIIFNNCIVHNQRLLPHFDTKLLMTWQKITANE